MTRRLSPAHLLSAAALLMPSLGLLAPLGLAPLLAAVAVGLVLVAPRLRVPFAPTLLPLAGLLLALALWGAASAIWSIIPGHSLFEAARLALLSVAGLVVVSAAIGLDEPGRAMVGRVVLAGFALGFIVAVVELLGGFPLHRAFAPGRVFVLPVLDRGADVLALFTWVVVRNLLARRHAAIAALVPAVTLFLLAHLISLSAVVSVLVACCTLALAWWRPRAVAAAIIAGFVALAIMLPLVPPTRNTVLALREEAPWLRTSAHHRLIIWRFTSDRIAEHPLLGWGMDASRAMPGGKTSVRDYMSLPPDFPLEGSVMPLHPHDALLQWWVELGVPGAVLGCLILAWVAWRTGRAPAPLRGVRATAIAAIAAALPSLLLSFGVWQSWWQSTLWLIAALVIATGPATMAAGDAGRRAAPR